MADSSGSISDLRKSSRLLCIPCHGHDNDAEGEDTGVGRPALVILLAEAVGDGTPDGMLSLLILFPGRWECVHLTGEKAASGVVSTRGGR